MLDLAGRGHRRQPVVPQVDGHRGHAVGHGQLHMLVRGGVGGVVPGLVERLAQHGRIERAGPGEPQLVVDHHPHADPGRRGRGQRLDLAVVGAYFGLLPAGHVDLDVLARPGPACHPLGYLQQLVRLTGVVGTRTRSGSGDRGPVEVGACTLVLILRSLRWSRR